MSEKEHDVIDRISSKLNLLSDESKSYFLGYVEGVADTKAAVGKEEKKADEE